MKWSVHQLRKLQSKGLTIDEKVDLSDIVKRDGEIRDISPVHITGRGDIFSTHVTFHLRIQGELILPCARTLVDVPYEFDIETDETFILTSTDEETGEDVHYIEQDIVDLQPVVEELIFLQVPIQVFSDEQNPEGAAPQSGHDWQVITEEDQEQKVDPRLSVLQDYFKDKKD